MAIEDIQLLMAERDQGIEARREFTIAIIITVDGTVNVPGKPGYVWIQELAQPQSHGHIRNRAVQAVAGLPVKIGHIDNDSFEREILGEYDGLLPGVDQEVLDASSVRAHRLAHQYASEATKGVDAVLIYQPAIQMLKTTADGVSLTVTTRALPYGKATFTGGTTDLTASVPATSNKKRYVLLYLDTLDNTLKTLDGDEVTNTEAFIAPKPSTPSAAIASAYVLLVTGQSTISATTGVEDARRFLHPDEIDEPFRWIVGDAAARTALTGLTVGDLYKLALQLDDNTVWLLTSITPVTWEQIGGGGPVSNVHIIDDSGTNNIATAVTLNHGTDQTPTTGIGVRMAAETDNTTAEDAPIGNLDWWWSSMSNQRSNVQLSARSFGNEMPLMTLMPHSTATTAPGNFNTGSVDIQVHRTNSNQIAPPEGVCIGLRCQGGVTGSPFPSIIVGKDIVNAEWRNVAFGMDITMSPGEFCTAIGPSVTTNQDHTTAVGYLAIARRPRTTNIAGTMVLKRDAGTFSSHMVNFSSAEVFIATQEEDLTTTFDRTLGPLATSLRFFISEVGIIVTSITNMTVQPTIRAGIVGNLAKQVAAVQTTNLTAAYKRERFNPLVPDDGEPSLSVGVTVGATADVMLGRFYMKGLLLEEE